MRKPGDEFGRELRKLRKAHGFGTVALSEAVGRGRNFIGRWERDATAIPKRDVLLRVVEVLQLSDVDRVKLLRLADLRGAPDTEKHRYESAPVADSDRHLLLALLEVEHDWPSEPATPTTRSERAQLLIDAAAWALAEFAASGTDLLPPFSSIRWPEPLHRLGIVPHVESTDAIDPPADLLEQELPFLDQLAEPLTNLDTFTQSVGMARVYRRLLFSDLTRASDAASYLESWQYDRSQALATCVSLRFGRLAPHERSGAQDVNVECIASVAMRSLACYLWTAGQTRKNKTGWWCDYEPVDVTGLLGFITRPEHVWNYGQGDDVRSGIYLMRSRIWPFALSAIRHQFGIEPGSQPELEAQLKRVYLDDDTRKQLCTNPWLFAAVDPKVLLAYARALEAAIPPADEQILWRPGESYPEGHPFWKAGETALVRKDEAEPIAKAKTRKRRKSTRKKTAKRKGKKR